jgi:hypothetical protein
MPDEPIGQIYYPDLFVNLPEDDRHRCQVKVVAGWSIFDENSPFQKVTDCLVEVTKSRFHKIWYRKGDRFWIAKSALTIRRPS